MNFGEYKGKAKRNPFILYLGSKWTACSQFMKMRSQLTLTRNTAKRLWVRQPWFRQHETLWSSVSRKHVRIFFIYVTLLFPLPFLTPSLIFSYVNKFTVVFAIYMSQHCGVVQAADPELNHSSWHVCCSSGDSRAGITESGQWISGRTLQGNTSKGHGATSC